jgi:hypothetical protein
MYSRHLPFPQRIHTSWPIETLLHLRNAVKLTLVEPEFTLLVQFSAFLKDNLPHTSLAIERG